MDTSAEYWSEREVTGGDVAMLTAYLATCDLHFGDQHQGCDTIKELPPEQFAEAVRSIRDALVVELDRQMDARS